eukprot:TRINITY_DN2580_c0_g1_i4.p1 TRINITY_DN2580_c0_g1~~TRINITY_DN2580_c0_g1_i4.p1  ORF type:complete len:751 (+),score=262.72 TRINITY_DN2580_c0_g1_i4:113-2365(+)
MQKQKFLNLFSKNKLTQSHLQSFQSFQFQNTIIQSQSRFSSFNKNQLFQNQTNFKNDFKTLNFNLLKNYFSKSFTTTQKNILQENFNFSFDFNLSKEQIFEQANLSIETNKKELDKIVNLNDEELNWNNTFGIIANEDIELQKQTSFICFLQYIHPSIEIRNASMEVSQLISNYAIENALRTDVYNKLVQFSKSPNINKCDSLQLRFVKKVLLEFERSGAGLTPELRQILLLKKQELSNICIEFQKNLNEDVSKILFTREELQGMPDNFFEQLIPGPEQNSYYVSLKYPEYTPVMQFCENVETRRKLNVLHLSKCKDINTPLFEKGVILRREIANIFGYKNHASFVLDQLMAKSFPNAFSFLQELSSKLDSKMNEQMQNLINMKKDELTQTNQEFEPEIKIYDIGYYQQLNLKKNYSVDNIKIKNYFPLETVINGMLKVFERILGLKYNLITTIKTWHEDVKVYAVNDANTNQLKGLFFLDLHPRDGKYGHAAVIDHQNYSTIERNGIKKTEYAMASIVANFTKPTIEQPSLLQFHEVVTLFHEFGHLMHHICYSSNFARFSSLNVERDFIETPSQLFENWCYEPQVLNIISGHYLNSDDKLPKELLQNLINAKFADNALHYKRQIFFGIFDFMVHSFEEEKIDSAHLFADLMKKITSFELPKNTNGAAQFAHLFGEYDSQYYVYLYSEIFAHEIFGEFKKNGVLNPEIGMKLRDLVFAPGATQDSSQTLLNFLGREPTQQTFLKNNSIL